ncbi:hypothetical protein [Denitrificimonas caeni]|uniref:hypothetical protein n=1 Tax=Denitrificimonas caeni TaxID=521720 RepID=UPI0019667949|nr:hypothetical protein [Denitrificimonas caeni]
MLGKDQIALFKIAEETEYWAFLLNTVIGALLFTLSIASFTLIVSIEKLIISLLSLVFVAVLTQSMKARQNKSLKIWRNEKLYLEKSEKLSNVDNRRLGSIVSGLAYTEKNIFTLKKVSAFAFGFYVLAAVFLTRGFALVIS